MVRAEPQGCLNGSCLLTKTTNYDAFVESYEEDLKDRKFALSCAKSQYEISQDLEFGYEPEQRDDKEVFVKKRRMRKEIRDRRRIALKNLRDAIRNIDDELRSETDEKFIRSQKMGRFVGWYNLEIAVDQVFQEYERPGTRGQPKNEARHSVVEIYMQHRELRGLDIKNSKSPSNNKQHKRFRDDFLYSDAIIGLHDFLKEIDPECCPRYEQAQNLVKRYLRQRS